MLGVPQEALQGAVWLAGQVSMLGTLLSPWTDGGNGIVFACVIHAYWFVAGVMDARIKVT